MNISVKFSVSVDNWTAELMKDSSSWNRESNSEELKHNHNRKSSWKLYFRWYSESENVFTDSPFIRIKFNCKFIDDSLNIARCTRMIHNSNEWYFKSFWKSLKYRTRYFFTWKFIEECIETETIWKVFWMQMFHRQQHQFKSQHENEFFELRIWLLVLNIMKTKSVQKEKSYIFQQSQMIRSQLRDDMQIVSWMIIQKQNEIQHSISRNEIFCACTFQRNCENLSQRQHKISLVYRIYKSKFQQFKIVWIIVAIIEKQDFKTYTIAIIRIDDFEHDVIEIVLSNEMYFDVQIKYMNSMTW